jgi:hypothetical protein
MNVIEKANEVSIFTRWTQNVAQTTTPWEYGMSKNVPPHTRHYTEDRPVDFEPSRVTTWTIPRLGLLKKVVLKVDSSFVKSRFWFFSVPKTIVTNSEVTVVGSVEQATHVFIAPPSITKTAYTNASTPVTRVADFKKAFNDRLKDLHAVAGNATQNPYQDGGADALGVIDVAILTAAMADPKFPCFAISGSVDTGFFFRKPGGIAHMFSMYEIRARNREIARLYPENIEYEAHSVRKYPIESLAEGAYSTTGVNNVKPIPAMEGDNLMSYFKDDGAGSYVLTEYIEPRFSYFTKLKQAFLTSFCEDLTLTLTANSLEAMNSLYPLFEYVGGTVKVTPTWHWINPRPEDLARLRQAMTAAPQGIPRLQASTMFEGGAQTSFANDQISLTMNVPYPVTRTIFSLDVAENGLPSLKRGDNRLSISTVALEASGVEVFKWSADQLHDHMSNGSYVNSAWKDRLYCINWSSLGDNTEQGGFLPARNLYNVQLKITTTKDTLHADTGKRRTTIYSGTKNIGRLSARDSASMIHEAGRLLDGSPEWSAVSGGNTDPDYKALKQLSIPYSGLVRETGFFPLERTQVMINTKVETKDVKLKVFHEYYTIESTIPSNGQVNVTAFD